MKEILFINGSPNKYGNTAALAEHLLKGRNYKTLNLIDYKIYPLGQSYADDIVLGWYSMQTHFSKTGILRERH